jgi:hypothetical protein
VFTVNTYLFQSSKNSSIDAIVVPLEYLFVNN